MFFSEFSNFSSFYFVGRQVFLPIYLPIHLPQVSLRHLPQVSLRHLRRRDRRIRLEPSAQVFAYSCLRSYRRLSLDVVDIEVLLEVEVRELVLGLEVEELEESRITLDVVLVLEVLLLHVRRDELRDV